MAALNGSWAFILFLIGLTVAWCVLNAGWMLRHPMDPYPFQFFNLALAILVGLQGPLIVMSQNRQSLKDRARADTDFKVNLKNEVNIETLLRELARTGSGPINVMTHCNAGALATAGYGTALGVIRAAISGVTRPAQ